MDLRWQTDDAGWGDPLDSLLLRLHTQPQPARPYLIDWNGITVLVACVAWVLDFHDLFSVGEGTIQILSETQGGQILMSAMLAWMRRVGSGGTDLQRAVGLVRGATEVPVCPVWDPTRSVFCERSTTDVNQDNEMSGICEYHRAQLLQSERNRR